MSHPLIQFLSRPKVRIGLGASAVAVLVGGAALTAFSAGGETTTPRMGPALSVAVVPPVERDFDPGGVMEVGTLNDGFDRAVLDRQVEQAYAADLPLDAYAGEDWDMPELPRMPRPTPVETEPTPIQAYRAVVDRVAAEVDQARDRLDDGSRHFGFDRPRPDYAAERAERWAAREARRREQDAQDTSIPYTEAIQYSPE